MYVLPELARLATKSQTQIEFVLWCALHEQVTQYNHSGHFKKNEVKKLCGFLSFTTRHWTRIFKNGDSIFWGIDNKRLYIRSRKRVIKALQLMTNDKLDIRVSMMQKIAIEINPTDTTQLIRAKLYHAWFLARGSVTIARDTIQDTFGLSHDQQRAYEALLGDRMRVKSNHCHIDSDDYENEPMELPNHTYNFRYNRSSASDKSTNATMIAYQLPNTYLALPYNATNTATRMSKNARRQCLARLWHTNTRHNHTTLYHDNMTDFMDNGTMDSYVYVGFNGSKRILKYGQYL